MTKKLIVLTALLLAFPASATVNQTHSYKEYTCSGATTYAIDFEFLEKDHIVVTRWLTATPSVVTTMTQDGSTDPSYTVTMYNGGTTGLVTLTNGTTCATNYTLRIDRTLPLTQAISFRSQGTFNPWQHEYMGDKLTMLIQQYGSSIAQSTETSTALNNHIGSADDHTAYFLLAGRSGGQDGSGGTADGDDLILRSTSAGSPTYGWVKLYGGTAELFVGHNNGADPGATLDGDFVVASGHYIDAPTGYFPIIYGSTNAGTTLVLETSDETPTASSKMYLGRGSGDSTILMVDEYNTRVGIKTASPSYTFEVTGDGYFSTDLTVGDDLTVLDDFYVTDKLYTPYLYGGDDSGDDLVIGSTTHATKGDIYLGTNSILNSFDSLGIGTTTPADALDVVGGIDCTGDIDVGSDANVTGDVGVSDGSAVGIASNERFVFNAAGTIDVTGAELVCTNNSAAATFGLAATDADVVIAFDALTNQGSITYMEDEDRFDFDNDVDVVGDLTCGTMTSDSSATAVSFVIGANSLDTNEWANLDGQDQTVATTSSPTFDDVTTTDDVIVGDDITLADGGTIGITGNEIIRFYDTSKIYVEGAALWMTENSAAASFGLPGNDADVVLWFRATTNSASLTFMEDEDRFDFGAAVDVTGAMTAGTVTTTGAITAGTSVTGTSFVIGANSLDTNEWAYLDGQNQSVATTSSPTFVNVSATTLATSGTVTCGDDCSATDDLIAGDDLTVTDDGTIGGDLGVTGAVTALSYGIGANVLDTNEWAFLDGQDQDVSTGGSPTFVDVTTTDDVIVGDDVSLADGGVVGIPGNETLVWDAAGSINVTNASMQFKQNSNAAGFGNVYTDADVVLNFLAVSNTGSITYMEDENRFDFAQQVKTGHSMIAPVVYGSTAANGDLYLFSTTDGTRGHIYLGATSGYDQTNSRLGIGKTVPTEAVDVVGDVHATINIHAGNTVYAANDVNATDDFVAGDDITCTDDLTVGDDADVVDDLTAGTIASDSTISGTAITGTSFVIGANSLTTSEWAYLDGQNQSVATTSSPTFNSFTATADITAGDDLFVADDSTIGGTLTVTETVSAEQLTSTDDATITDDMSVGGDLGVTGQIDGDDIIASGFLTTGELLNMRAYTCAGLPAAGTNGRVAFVSNGAEYLCCDIGGVWSECGGKAACCP